MTTLSEALAASLHQHASHTFALMGNGNAHFIHALLAGGMPLTEVRHEAAAVASADAYARVSARLAIATTSYGAGFTNTLTALAEAARARTPLLLVVGDAPNAGLRPWDIDQEMAAAAVGVRSYTVTPHDLNEVVDRAVSGALRRRLPVVIGIPYDLATAPMPAAADHAEFGIDLADPEITRSLLAATRSPETSHAVTPKTSTSILPGGDDLRRAAASLAKAERPLVLAGRGAWNAGAAPELNEVAEWLGALTATTALARGIFTDAHADLGITGGFGQDAAMRVIADADAVLVVGASLNQFTMRFGELFGPRTTVIRVDIEEVTPPRFAHEVHYQLIQGDAKTVLAALHHELRALPQPHAPWRQRQAGLEVDGVLRERDRGTDHPEGLCADGRLDPRAVAVRLAELLPEDRYVTSDGGHFIGWANMFWPVHSPERMIMVGTAYQSIGLGFASVAGVAAAAPESTVVVTSGDGGGLMSLADLETAIRSTQSLVIVLWNDGAYGAEVHLYGTMGLNEAPMRIPEVNFAGLAEALGARGVKVTCLADLDALTQWRAAGARGAIMLDCRVSSSVVAPYQREIQQVNGIIVREA